MEHPEARPKGRAEFGLVTCGCDTPGCGHEAAWLHARCHPGAGLWACYHDGRLLLICLECRRHVLTVEIK